MQFISTIDVHQALERVAPTDIAVAFLGADWSDYIDANRLEQIVVSPNLGTNPKALRELIRVLKGWSKVHLLRTLHSKIYVGKDAGAFGSFNLSERGINPEHQEEFGALVTGVQEVEFLRSEVDRLRQLADSRLGTDESKNEALVRLEREDNLAKARQTTGYVEGPGSQSTLRNFDMLTDRDFLIVLWHDADLRPNTESIQKQAPDLIVADIEADRTPHFAVIPSDAEIYAPGTPVLLWKSKKCGNPTITPFPKWMVIDHVIDEGCKFDDFPEYTTLVTGIEMKGRLAPPFELGNKDEAARNALRHLLSQDEFSAFRLAAGDTKPYSLRSAIPLTKELIRRAKAAIDGA